MEQQSRRLKNILLFQGSLYAPNQYEDATKEITVRNILTEEIYDNDKAVALLKSFDDLTEEDFTAMFRVAPSFLNNKVLLVKFLRGKTRFDLTFRESSLIYSYLQQKGYGEIYVYDNPSKGTMFASGYALPISDFSKNKNM